MTGAVEWLNGKLRILDQSRLPGEEVFADLDNYSDVIQAINIMLDSFKNKRNKKIKPRTLISHIRN